MNTYNEKISEIADAIKARGYFTPEIWFAFNFCGYPVYFTANARPSEGYTTDRVEYSQNYNETEDAVEQGFADLLTWVENLPSVAETRRIELVKRAAKLQRDIEAEGFVIPNTHFEKIIKVLTSNAIEDHRG